jgi:hypothetical protein
MDFGKVNFAKGRTSGPQTVTALNRSDSVTVVISSIVIDGDFSMVTDCGATIAPQATCTMTIRFTPTDLGQRNGSLTVRSNAGNHLATVILVGQGSGGKKARKR